MKSLLDWGRPFHWREALICIPAMPLLLLTGRAVGHEISGVVAAGAAFSVAFGASRALCGRRWGAMLAATAGVTAATFCGTLLGGSMPLLLACSAIAAAGCAALGLVDDNLWWVALQGVIALLVAGFLADVTPASFTDYSRLGHACARAFATLAGGVTQVLCVVVLAKIFPSAREPLFTEMPMPPADAANLLAQAVRASVAVLLAGWAAQAVGLANGYWAPMTALLLIKPGLRDTRTRGVSRLVGTVIGSVLATGVAVACHDGPTALVIGLAVASGGAFALQQADYGAMTAAITASVIMLTSFVAGHATINAEHRLMNTLLGGCVALLVAWVIPQRELNSAAS